jgi:hypothetical protein
MFDAQALRDRGYVLADLKKKLPSIEDLICWFAGSDRNIAIVTRDDFMVVDFDSVGAYARFINDNPLLAYTLTIRTKRGYHLYYHLSESISQDVNVTWPDIEIKHSGLCILTEPSVHPAGHQYRAIQTGLLNRYTVLRLTRADVLPFVEGSKKPVFSLCGRGEPSERSERGGGSAPMSKALPISQYLINLGYTLKSTGEGKYITNCPFHNDKNPSFWIDDNHGNCNCYRPDCASPRAMDAIDLHARLNNISNSKAIKQLQKPKVKARKRRQSKREKEAIAKGFDLMSRQKERV